jgi:ubiquinone/menaquinone biosynthesis C-methylase UbiE
MKDLLHKSAKASHYNKEADNYDAFNEENSRVINVLIEKILAKNKARSVLDITCGTGSQVFWLAKRGFEVVGSDINARMLKIAKSKAKEEGLVISFLREDMRTIQAGQFDAVISIFNAVGHLTKEDFERAMSNIYRNLKEGGVYIFDIFNLAYLQKDDRITQLTIDWQKTSGNTKIREIQYSTIDCNGILASYTTSYTQKGAHAPKITKSKQTLQIYTAQQLEKMLQRKRFKILQKCAVDGAPFSETETERMVIVAKKAK